MLFLTRWKDYGAEREPKNVLKELNRSICGQYSDVEVKIMRQRLNGFGFLAGSVSINFALPFATHLLKPFQMLYVIYSEHIRVQISS